MAMVRMTLMDYSQMTLMIDFYYLQRMKVVTAVVEAVDVDHCNHPAFVETAAVAAVVQTQLKMMTIVVVMMVNLPVEYVVVTLAVRVVSMVEDEDD